MYGRRSVTYPQAGDFGRYANKIMIKLILFIVALIASNSIYAGSPSEVFFKYTDALNNGENKTAYSYLSNAMKNSMAIEVFEENNQPTPYEQIYTELIETELINEIKSENSAILEIKTIVPNKNIILPILFSASYAATNTLKGQDALRDYVQQSLEKIKNKKPIPYEYNFITIKMVKENGEWKVGKDNF